MAEIASAMGAELDESQSQEEEADVYAIKCDRLDSGLGVSVSFGGQLFTFDDEDLDGGALDESETYCALNMMGSDVSLIFFL